MIINFQIFDELVYSDHCALFFTLSGRGQLRKNLVYKNHREKRNTYPTVYKWNPDLLPAYHDRLLNTGCINLYDQLLNKIKCVNLDSGAAVDAFNDYMNKYPAIGPLFSKRNNDRSGTFPVNAWFDKECKGAKTMLHDRRRNIISEQTRHSYNNSMRNYKALILRKKG